MRRVPPPRGMVLLVVLDDGARGRNRVGRGTEERHVGNPLFLVYDQVLHHVQVLRFGLLAKGMRVGAVGPAVIHVDVEVSAPPARGGEVADPREPEARALAGARRPGDGPPPPRALP